ncbi:DUF6920 family protein [Hyunsoonleella rubra]|uniref:DUF6920 family protein n=1 Tax=Hyunsoonleella rubra TaxID=1737062 RepID=A0ABW5T960_9FLAO
MRLAFGILLFIHGAIHLIGFVTAFYSTKTPMQVLGISKSIGTLWLITFILFMAVAPLFLTNKKWFPLAFIAVGISQILIIMAWNDAKFGTIANIIILLVSISACGSHKFNKMVKEESATLINNVVPDNSSEILEKDILHLPKVIQKWMRNSGVIGQTNITTVRLKQKGQLKLKPGGKWMPFTAVQYFNCDNPAFIWIAKIDNNSIIYTLGRDKFKNGKAEMLIKFLGSIPVVSEAQNPKIDSGAMQRFLSEMCWFPSIALRSFISWEAIDNTSAKAILTVEDKSVSGIFTFNANGDLVSFETDRFYGGAPESKKEKWLVNILDYKTFDNYKIPNKCSVVWQLKAGDYNWLNLEIIDIDYNVSAPYK